MEPQTPTESQRFQSHLQLQLNQISHPVPEQPQNNISKFQNAFTERDFDFVSIKKSNFIIRNNFNIEKKKKNVRVSVKIELLDKEPYPAVKVSLIRGATATYVKFGFGNGS